MRGINVWEVGNICKREVTAKIMRLVWLQDKMWIVVIEEKEALVDKGVGIRGGRG